MPISHLHWPAVACQQAGTWHVPITPITGNFDEKFGWLCCNLLYPRSTEGGMGVYWIHPDVCPSVGPSVDMVSRTFWKNYCLNSFHTWHLPSWGESLDPYTFYVPSLIFGPLVAKYLAKNEVSGTFWKTIGPIHFLPGIYPYGVSLLTPIHFHVLWWPNNWAKMGFPELFEKTIGSIHFIPGIYPYRVSFLTPLHFRVPSLIFGPLVAKYLGENGVSGTFWKNYWLNSFQTWH